MSLSKGRGSKINKMLWTLFINDPKCGFGERAPPFVIHMCVASLVAGHKWGPSVRGVTFASAPTRNRRWQRGGGILIKNMESPRFNTQIEWLRE